MSVTTSVRQIRRDQQGLDPTDSDMGCGWCLLSSRRDQSRYYRVAHGTGLVSNEIPFPCRALVACLRGTLSPRTPPAHSRKSLVRPSQALGVLRVVRGMDQGTPSQARSALVCSRAPGASALLWAYSIHGPSHPQTSTDHRSRLLAPMPMAQRTHPRHCPPHVCVRCPSHHSLGDGVRTLLRPPQPK